VAKANFSNAHAASQQIGLEKGFGWNTGET
jgi:hypothetical protein